MSEARRSPGRSALGAVGLLAAVLVVVAAAFTGPPHAVPRRAPRASVPPLATPPARPPLRPGRGGHPDLAVLGVVLQVIAVVLVVAVLVLVVVMLVRLLRGRSLPGLPRPQPIVPAEVSGAVAPGAPPAEVVRRGIAFSLEQMDRERVPADAVVRAWLGLQQTADDAGLPRGRAETPTEFTVRVLTRTTADADAAGTLLRLYLAARFGAAGTTDDDVARAREALRRLETSWALPVPERAGRRG